ncbi:hypothetical protein HPP92_004316 [Vanilla planifolia]|uniref:Uncharacterized protein n=1 Tax=Vanilla planifolia TaxID=51239 RepID=A0A835RW38_VANPL|nr:hypothetical protein HPP92_004316 [Vanilla planifolia]
MTFITSSPTIAYDHHTRTNNAAVTLLELPRHRRLRGSGCGPLRLLFRSLCCSVPILTNPSRCLPPFPPPSTYTVSRRGHQASSAADRGPGQHLRAGGPQAAVVGWVASAEEMWIQKVRKGNRDWRSWSCEAVSMRARVLPSTDADADVDADTCRVASSMWMVVRWRFGAL